MSKTEGSPSTNKKTQQSWGSFNEKSQTLESGSDSQKNIINQVIITDIQMPITSMIVFMVKWAVASIPAFIILFVLFVFFSSVVSEILTKLN